MTEAIYLALIALGNEALLLVSAYAAIKMVIKQKPSNFKFSWSKHGNVELSFESKARK